MANRGPCKNRPRPVAGAEVTTNKRSSLACFSAPWKRKAHMFAFDAGSWKHFLCSCI